MPGGTRFYSRETVISGIPLSDAVSLGRFNIEYPLPLSKLATRKELTHWLSTQLGLIRQFLNLDTSGSRALQAIVFPRLQGVEYLEGEGVLTAFLGAFFCERIRDYCHKR